MTLLLLLLRATANPTASPAHTLPPSTSHPPLPAPASNHPEQAATLPARSTMRPLSSLRLALGLPERLRPHATARGSACFLESHISFAARSAADTTSASRSQRAPDANSILNSSM